MRKFHKVVGQPYPFCRRTGVPIFSCVNRLKTKKLTVHYLVRTIRGMRKSVLMTWIHADIGCKLAIKRIERKCAS